MRFRVGAAGAALGLPAAGLLDLSTRECTRLAGLPPAQLPADGAGPAG